MKAKRITIGSNILYVKAEDGYWVVYSRTGNLVAEIYDADLLDILYNSGIVEDVEVEFAEDF